MIIKMNTEIAILFLTIVSFTRANSVLDLTDDNFATRIASIDATLVMFYDPWSEVTSEIVKDFDKASELLRDVKQTISLGKVNCEGSGKETCLKYSIEHIYQYPKFKIFRMGRLGQDYGGPDDADGIAKFMRSRYGPASTELLTLAEIEEFLAAKDASILGLFEKGNAVENLFFQYADHMKGELRFGHSSTPEVLSQYNEKNSILLFRSPQFHNKLEPNYVAFKGDSQDELARFIKKNWHGLVGHRKPDNIDDFGQPNVIAYYEVDYVTNAKKTNYWRNRILQVAKNNTDIKFCISSGDDFRSELERFGSVYLGETPLVTANDKEGRRYKMTSDFSVENLKQFVSDLKEGKLEPFKKSQPIPKTNDEPVKVAVAKNFDEIVTDNGKDTFLEVYAPWCQYCKDIAPVFDELGAKMVDEDVEIVKFDGFNNEVPSTIPLQGFPSFFWLTKNAKFNPVFYTEGKDLDSFVEYIAKHATNELKNYDRSGQIKKTEL